MWFSAQILDRKKRFEEFLLKWVPQLQWCIYLLPECTIQKYVQPTTSSELLPTTKWRQTTAIWNYLSLLTAFTIETKIQKMCYK